MNRCFRDVIRSFLLIACVFTTASSAAARDSKLLRSLTGRNETVRMRTVTSIDPLRHNKALPDLIEAAHRLAQQTERDEVVRPSTMTLLYLIGQFQDSSAEQLLVELLDAPHAGIAMVSADALGRNKRYGAIEALKQQVSRPEYAGSYGFRFNLVRSMAQMQHPEAVKFLSELRQTLDGQLRFHVEELLREVTVSHFQGDEEAFEEWKESDEQPKENGDKRESFFAAGFQPESLDRIRLEPQNYYGIDIHAKRLMFIIDHSDSMKEYWGGATRLQRAKFELIRAIDELPEDAEFAIIFYHTTVRQWRDELVYANEENKREAINFVRRLAYGDKTNTYGALRRALEFDDDLEAVFLLTDGRPTIGDIVPPGRIVADILHRNRFRHLNFNTIGLAVGGQTEAFLRALADKSNGEFRAAD